MTVTIKPTAAKKKSTSAKKKPAKGGKIDKSMISGPTAGSFRHVAHMGYDSEKGFTSTNVDPSWQQLLTSLQDQGVDPQLIEENMDFIKSFIKDAQKDADKAKKKPPPPPSRSRTVLPGSGSRSMIVA